MKKKTKNKRTWTWEEIKAEIRNCYDHDGRNDDWGVRIIYAGVLVEKLRKRLYKRV